MRSVYKRTGGLALICWLCFGAGTWCGAQSAANERTFTQSKAVVEKEVKALASSASGRLPILDGFAQPGAHSLDHYQRGYYQCAVQVVQNSSGGSLVKVTAKITAWYSDGTQSGYQVLPSNGRLESDFLDHLEDALSSMGISSSTGGKPSQNSSSVSAAPAKKGLLAGPPVSKPSISAPAPGGSTLADAIAASRTPMKSAEGIPAAPSLSGHGATQRHDAELEKEAEGLEEILRNQSHPNNLAAVKNPGTPVMTNPNEGAKVLFLADAEDEFEILDSNTSWVHVRVSGLSRGWILRTSVELPEDSDADTPMPAAPVKKATEASNPPTAAPFQVENEQIASFPGNWEPLRGKTVKIVSVQKTSPAGAEAESKLAFAKNLFDQEYAELSRASSTTAGVVVIFDSEDGGMLAATLPVLKLWKGGSLSDEAMWRRCYFDPPEMVGSAVTQ
jgi:hypothetical protein